MQDSLAAPFGNDISKTERYKAFWRRDPVERPLVGFTLRGWFPMLEYPTSAAWSPGELLTPDMIDPESFLDEEERMLREGELIADDILRGACPLTSIRWLPALLGCRLRVMEESVFSEEETRPWKELSHLQISRSNPWLAKYIEFVLALVERSAGRFPVSHGILLGPSDIAAAVRGSSQSILDLIDEPERAAQLLRDLGSIFKQINEEAWKRIPLFAGGYFDASYQLWAPKPIIRIQEDATNLYSPKLYRRFLQPVDRELARDYPCAFMHLHSTSLFILEAMLEIEEIRCFQINRDVAGPPVPELIPAFRAVQQAGRSLIIRGPLDPDEARLVLEALEPRGLYFYLMVETMGEVDDLRVVFGM
jgi:hypothetical protein